MYNKEASNLSWLPFDIFSISWATKDTKQIIKCLMQPWLFCYVDFTRLRKLEKLSEYNCSCHLPKAAAEEKGDLSVLELSLTASQWDLAPVQHSHLYLLSFRDSYLLVKARTGQREKERERELSHPSPLSETSHLINETIDSVINACAQSY